MMKMISNNNDHDGQELLMMMMINNQLCLINSVDQLSQMINSV